MKMTMKGQLMTELIRAADPDMEPGLMEDCGAAIGLCIIRDGSCQGWSMTHAMLMVDKLHHHSEGTLSGQVKRDLVRRGIRRGAANYLADLGCRIVGRCAGENGIPVGETG